MVDLSETLREEILEKLIPLLYVSNLDVGDLESATNEIIELIEERLRFLIE